MYYVSLYVFPFQCCIFDPDMWDVQFRTCISLSVYLYSVSVILYLFSLSRCISPLCTMFIILFPLYILSLSIILYLLDLSLTETVKRAYGQWMVYGEFNTLGFVSSPRLAYKF